MCPSKFFVPTPALFFGGFKALVVSSVRFRKSLDNVTRLLFLSWRKWSNYLSYVIYLECPPGDSYLTYWNRTRPSVNDINTSGAAWLPMSPAAHNVAALLQRVTEPRASKRNAGGFSQLLRARLGRLGEINGGFRGANCEVILVTLRTPSKLRDDQISNQNDMIALA
jgi:hypothetical protein